MTSSDLEFYPEDFPYVVGIDFGTTFSGCSCVFADDNIDEIFDITEWPRKSNFIYPKVPTASYYERDNRALVAWGYEAINKASQPNIIADYLRAFYKHVHEQFQTRLGAVYDTSKFRYCLTVPAIWDDRAKATMREAAIIAGIVSRSDHPDRLMLTSEPEAAALYCEKKSNQFNLSHEQRFMICDAGGGTVDLIVFEIEDSSGVKSLREVTKGSGGSCGSTFLDKNMRKLLKKRFGSHAKNNKAAIQYLMDHFVTTTKPEFENEDDEYFTVPAVLNLKGGKMSDIGVDDGRLCVSVDEIREDVFEPIAKQVLNLISDQINQSQKQIDAIFMVGGFGQSRYLGKRVQDTFKDKVGNICVPSRGEISVMRGAVMFGVNPGKVSHRILRRTYGLMVSLPFDPLLDPPEKKYTTRNGEITCDDHFSAYATKGECVAMSHCILKRMSLYPRGKLVNDLYAYDMDGKPPRFVTDPGVRRAALFELKLPVFQDVKPDEKVFFTVNMYFGKTEILIEVNNQWT
ncbi:hypothetical protein PHYBLDRAFT_145256 [Phycomyces blakesleeanus NRRL 1555(-)]|uniref:Actin-like ATPase domain-containing protein n=1 Tax=Phycomyces blakesleeanus (strain ATCC 8743b / DSM 1359 / FGSC 10004 / NBRC 33097 / NRRL 1555) TaxID=763407 RepID=A0A162PTJ1_PHYB8|nr:hypothetical protein PHYBLDRAFT_145256 [Phycomyces blakesleeanus NRRL 1555(-)]OAD73786.1 hypothetical protein PHYBLDRAFT_145256 [Phycomyces blakesleeanus NRRL 1555(-)]|eukprot:XP_018291826.1 hypothetical protein PHYBLDRAFT_145256 [Phycomyces blakesleeanus NRRL 1555(-)]